MPSRRQKLELEQQWSATLNAIVEPVSRRDAAQAANVYISSFAYQPHEPDVLLQQLTDLFVTLPRAVLSGINNPQYGAVTKSDRPCLKTVRAFVEEWMRPLGPKDTWEPEPPKEPLTATERDRVARVLENVKRSLAASSDRLRGKSEAKERSVLSDEQNAAIEAYIAGK